MVRSTKQRSLSCVFVFSLTLMASAWVPYGAAILPTTSITVCCAVITVSTAFTTSSASTTSFYPPTIFTTTTVSGSPVVTNTLLTTTTTTGSVASTSTTTFTSPLITSSSTTMIPSSTTTVTQTGTTTTSTGGSDTTTSTGTTLSTTTSGGTVTVTQTGTFDILLTEIFQELEQFEEIVLTTLGFQVTATPVGQQVNQVIVTTTTPAQVPMTVSYSVVGGGSPTAPVFHYVLKGAAKSLTLTKTATKVSVDAGSTWTVTPNPLGGSSSSQRWHSSQTLTGIASATTIVFTFQHQYHLTMKVSSSTAGSVTPSSGWYNVGQTVTIKASAKTGHTFKSWTGTGTGSYTGTSATHTITMYAAITETANFT